MADVYSSCGCGTNCGDAPDVRVVAGNDLTVEAVVSVWDAKECVYVPMDLTGASDVALNMVTTFTKVPGEGVSASGSRVSAFFPAGRLGKGVYGVEITFRDADGRCRAFERSLIEVVESSGEATVESTAEGETGDGLNITVDVRTRTVRIGGTGATDYPSLTGKPSINGVVLEGDKTSEELGIMGSDKAYTKEEVNQALETKADKTLTANQLNQLGQEIGAEIITSYELVVSSSSQSKRIDFAKAQKGRFKIAFDGGSPSGLACKVVLYNGSTAAQNFVLESKRFGFNKWVDYSGNEFDIAVFTVYGDMVVTAGEANTIVELGISSEISSLEERIDAGEKSDFDLMVKTHGYNLSGSPVLDENGLLVQSGVSWADGSAGTLRKTDFNENVLEYAVVTVTHAENSKTVQYSYQFSELGEITKETINIS